MWSREKDLRRARILRERKGIEPKRSGGQTIGWVALDNYYVSPEMYNFLVKGEEPRMNSRTPNKTGLHPAHRHEYPIGFQKYGNYYLDPDAIALAKKLNEEAQRLSGPGNANHP